MVCVKDFLTISHLKPLESILFHVELYILTSLHLLHNKNYPSYQRSLDDIIGYGMVGISLIFFMLGLVVVIETIQYPNLTVTLSLLILIFFGPGVLIFLAYWYYFKKEGI